MPKCPKPLIEQPINNIRNHHAMVLKSMQSQLPSTVSTLDCREHLNSQAHLLMRDVDIFIWFVQKMSKSWTPEEPMVYNLIFPVIFASWPFRSHMSNTSM